MNRQNGNLRRVLSKSLAVSAVALSLALTGCTTTAEEKPQAEPAQEAAGTTAKCDEFTVSGDVAVGEPAKTVDGGDFCALKPNLDSDINTFSSDTANPALFDAGYTSEQLAQVQAKSAVFLVENIISSPVTGAPPEKVLEWVQHNEGVSPELIEAYVSAAPVEPGKSKITTYGSVFNSYEYTPPVVADGGPQITSANLSVKGITGRMNEDRVPDPALGVAITYETTTTYRVDPEKYKQWRKDLFYQMEISDYVHEIDEEGQDFEKPLFIDLTRDFILSYDATTIADGMKDPKVRTAGMESGSINNVLAYN